MGTSTTFWAPAQQFGHQYNILDTRTTFWAPAQHFGYQNNILGTRTTFLVPLQHFGYQKNILGTRTTFWAPAQHFGYQFNICFTSDELYIKPASCWSAARLPLWPQSATPEYGFNSLKPNDPYRGCTAPVTSKRCILYIYSTNIGTEYFKHGIHSPFFFPLQNAVCFIILTIWFLYYSHLIYRMC